MMTEPPKVQLIAVENALCSRNVGALLAQILYRWIAIELLFDQHKTEPVIENGRMVLLDYAAELRQETLRLTDRINEITK